MEYACHDAEGIKTRVDGDAYTGKTTLSDAVASWQKDLQDYAKQQGYQVK